MCPSIAPFKTAKPSQITRRETQVLELIAYEYSTQQIADELFVSYETAISHRKNLRKKLKVKNTAGLIRKAYEYGYLILNIRSVA